MASTKSRCLVVAAKRAMIQPLLRCMGQPYTTHHTSLHVETRLLNIQSLHSLACARLAHRWLSNNLDATNDTSRMFRHHALTQRTVTYTSPHPFSHIREAIRHITALNTFTTDPLHFTDIERHKLKDVIWEQQYQTWTEEKTHPLNSQYTITTPSHRHLPTYMHLDDPSTASVRSRLRFARAKLRVDMKRLGYPDITTVTCRQCHKEDETVRHVLEVCDATDVVAVRERMRKRAEKFCERKKEDIGKVWRALGPDTKDKHVTRKAHTYTGKFIMRMRKIFDF